MPQVIAETIMTQDTDTGWLEIYSYIDESTKQ